MKGVVVCVCVAKGGTMQMTTLEDLSIITFVFKFSSIITSYISPMSQRNT